MPKRRGWNEFAEITHEIIAQQTHIKWQGVLTPVGMACLVRLHVGDSLSDISEAVETSPDANIASWNLLMSQLNDLQRLIPFLRGHDGLVGSVRFEVALPDSPDLKPDLKKTHFLSHEMLVMGVSFSTCAPKTRRHSVSLILRLTSLPTPLPHLHQAWSP